MVSDQPEAFPNIKNVRPEYHSPEGLSFGAPMTISSKPSPLTSPDRLIERPVYRLDTNPSN